MHNHGKLSNLGLAALTCNSFFDRLPYP